MEITVLKCDRCKQEVDGLIEFSFINRNVKPESIDGSDDERYSDPLGFSGLLGMTKRYPTMRGGLCFNCTAEVLRWLGHSENNLNSKIRSFTG